MALFDKRCGKERKRIFVVFCLLFSVIPFRLSLGLQRAYCQESNISSVFIEGCTAFKSGDWTSAMMLLRRSVAYPEYDTEGIWYMLIISEMNGKDYDAAGSDCDTFMLKFPESVYSDVVQYQKGRTLYLVRDYDRCALSLSGFCHQHPESPLYPDALFWIAESNFAMARYDVSDALYTRIVEEFPASGKASDARYRLDTIASRKREEMLLYLLKKTGEEYSATKEDYERQLKTGNRE